MSEATADALAPDEADLARAESHRKATMDDAIADRRYYLERIGQALVKMKIGLVAAGFDRRTTDDQFTGRSGMKVDIGYAGGEYVVRVVSADINNGRTTNCRVTLDLWARQPQCVDALLRILTLIDQGQASQFWLDAGGSLLGIEAWVHDDESGSYLFGERPPHIEAMREEEAAEVARDAEPPDMSGSTRDVDR